MGAYSSEFITLSSAPIESVVYSCSAELMYSSAAVYASSYESKSIRSYPISGALRRAFAAVYPSSEKLSSLDV